MTSYTLMICTGFVDVLLLLLLLYRGRPSTEPFHTLALSKLWNQSKYEKMFLIHVIYFFIVEQFKRHNYSLRPKLVGSLKEHLL